MQRIKQAVASAALLCTVLVPGAAFAETLRMGGTGGAIGTMLALAEAYRKKAPSFQLNIVPNLGSNGGIKAVTAGAIDFAVIGRELKAEERATGLSGVPYGQTPLLVVTNKAGVKSVSRAQLAHMIGSPDAKWADGTAVRFILRPQSDAENVRLGEFSPEIKQALNAAHARPGMIRAATDQESADQSERLPGSLGTTSLALLRSEKRSLHVLNIDGVAPSVENLRSGDYPYGKPFVLVTNGTPSAVTQKFIDFVVSDEGRELLVRLGHLTAPRR